MGTSEPDDPPFSRLDGDRIVGFEPDLMQAIAREMAGGVELEAVIVARPDAFAELGNTHDLYVDLVTNTAGRQESVAMTNPYLLAGWTALVPVASPIVGFDELTSIALPGGTTLGIVLSEIIAETGADITLVTSDDPLGAVASGTADAVAGSSVTTIDGYRALEPPVLDIPIAIAVADPALRDEINNALDAVIEGGRWLEIYLKWFGDAPLYDPGTMAAVPPTD